MADEDDYADALGVINALERTCELEAKLRQAIQDTHPLTTTLDWDFSAADREREALLAIGEQLEYLEDKLREYRNMESREVDNKAVVLSQLDNVRRELVEVTQNRMPHVTFGKEVVKEVMQFATLSDGSAEGEPAPAGAGERRSPPPAGRRSGGRGSGAAASDGYPYQQQAASAAGGRWANGGGAGGEGGHPLPHRKANSEHGERMRAFAALMSPNRRGDAAGSPGASTLVSPGTATHRSPAGYQDPRSNSSSPYGRHPQPQAQRGGAGDRGGGAAAGPRLPPGAAPRRQINLDLAAINTSVRGVLAGTAGVRGSDRLPSAPAAAGPSPPTSSRYSYPQSASAAASTRRDYAPGGGQPSRPHSSASEQQQQAAGWAWGGSGSAANSARAHYGGGSSRPGSARGAGAGGTAQGGYAGPGGRAELGSRILSRLDPPSMRVRSASPVSLRAEDIYGAVNGASSGGGSSRAGTREEYGSIVRLRDMYNSAGTGGGGSAGGVASQQDNYGGMVRIRDMLDRAEKDLSKVQEEREAVRRSPIPARIFGSEAGNRFSDGGDRSGSPARSMSERGGATGYSPPRSRRHKPSIVGPDPTGNASAAAAPVSDSPYDLRGGREAAEPPSSVREGRRDRDYPSSGRRGDYPGGARPAPVGASHGATAPSGRGRGGAGRVAGALGWLVGGMLRLTLAGAAAALGVAVVGTAAKWGMHHLPAITTAAKKKTKPAPAQRQPKRDLPPWLAPSLAPPPGSPQRSRLPGAGGAAGGAYAGAAGGIFVGTTTKPAGVGAAGPHPLPQSPVIHVQPLPPGDLFPSMPPPDVNVAKG